jgi:hypothetical protein
VLDFTITAQNIVDASAKMLAKFIRENMHTKKSKKNQKNSFLVYAIMFLSHFSSSYKNS